MQKMTLTPKQERMLNKYNTQLSQNESTPVSNQVKAVEEPKIASPTQKLTAAADKVLDKSNAFNTLPPKENDKFSSLVQ